MVEHMFAFFLGSVLLILWLNGTTFLGFCLTGYDSWRYSVFGWFMIGLGVQVTLVGLIIIAYLLGWAILNGVSYIL